MSSADVDLSLGLSDDTVIDSNVMVLMDELDKEEASLLEASDVDIFVGKNVSCQTDFDYSASCSLPIFFCGLLSSECEAFTQCDIPVKVSTGVSCNLFGEEAFKSNGSIDGYPIKISVPMKSNNPLPYGRKTESFPNEEIVFKPKGTKPPLIVPPAAINPDRRFFEPITVNGSTLGDSALTFDPSNNKYPVKVISQSLKRKHADDHTPRTQFYTIADRNPWSNVLSQDLQQSQEQQVSGISYTTTLDEDPQLKAVEECLQKMKQEGEEETDGFDRVVKKNRINLLQNILQQEIKLEDGDEWITDDEVDEEPDDIQEHLEQSMKDDSQRTCRDCNLTFNSHLLLIEHVESNHVANICRVCGFTTTFKNKLDRHMVKHTKEKAFICDMCGKQYSQKQNLRDHISRFHNEEDNSSRYPYSCEHCKRMYRNQTNLIKHTETTDLKCDMCDEVLPCTGVLFRHRKNHTSCSCEFCDKTFQSKSALQIHVNIKHKDKGLQCSMCPKKFLFPSYLKLHFANAHSKDSPQFKCQECGFCAVTESYLKSHMTRMHSVMEKRKYVCQVCHKNFRSNARLVEHTRIHTGERPFACPVCLKTFYSQSNLYAHERTVHGRLSNYGSKESVEEAEMAPVMKKVFSSCYQCQCCSETFNNKKKLKTHMETEHNTTFEEMVSEMTDIEVAPMDFEMDNETVVQSEDYTRTENGKGNESPDQSVNARSALSLPAYVVPPSVNLVEIDGVQYHVIRST